MDKRCELRTEEDILVGYKIKWANGDKGLGIYHKGKLIGAIKADIFINSLNKGPHILIETQTNRL